MSLSIRTTIFFLCLFLCFSCSKKKYEINETNIIVKPIFNQKISPDIQSVIDNSYNFKFSEAIKQLDTLRLKNEDMYLVDLLSVGCLFWQYIAATTEEENNQAREAFTKVTSEIKEKIEQILDKEPDNQKAQYLLGFTEGSQSKFYAIEGDFFKAYRFGVKGYGRLRKLEKLNPYDYDTQFGIGLYKYYCATLLPKWFQNLSFMVPGIDVDREGGYQRVLLASKYAVFLKMEAELTLAQGNSSYEREYKKGVELSEKISKLYPENKVFAYTHSIALYYLGLQEFYNNNSERSIKLFKKAIKLANDKPSFRLRIRKKIFLTSDMSWKIDVPAEHEVLFSLYRELGRVYFYCNERELADQALKEGIARSILGNEIRAALLFELGRQHKILNITDANEYFKEALTLVGENSEIGAHCKTILEPEFKLPEIENVLYELRKRISINKVDIKEVNELKSKYNKSEYSNYQYEFYEILYQLYDLAGEKKIAEKYHDDVRIRQQLER